jgi:anti-sigma B factor antagonist
MTGSARRIDRDDNVVVIAVVGGLDAFSACNFRKRLELVGDYPAALVVDMTEVDFIDSAGLGALVGLARTARDRGAVVALAVSRPGVRSVLEDTGFGRIAVISDSLRHATAAVISTQPG